MLGRCSRFLLVTDELSGGALCFDVSRQYFIHRPGPVALKIDRDIDEPERLQVTDDTVSKVVVQDATNFVRPDFDPRRIAIVEPDAEKPEALITEKRFSGINFVQVLFRNCRTVWKAGREAGK